MTAKRIRRLALPLVGAVPARTVRRYVPALRAAVAPKDAFVHPSVLPGTTLEIDVGESWFDIAGTPCKVKYLVATLPFSDAPVAHLATERERRVAQQVAATKPHLGQADTVQPAARARRRAHPAGRASPGVPPDGPPPPILDAPPLPTASAANRGAPAPNCGVPSDGAPATGDSAIGPWPPTPPAYTPTALPNCLPRLSTISRPLPLPQLPARTATDPPHRTSHLYPGRHPSPRSTWLLASVVSSKRSFPHFLLTDHPLAHNAAPTLSPHVRPYLAARPRN